jgi:dipicolinate synthase subunit B
MEWTGIKVGFAFTGSFCTINKMYVYIEELVKRGADVFPMVSYSVATMDTRFAKAEDTLKRLKEITGKEVIKTIPEAEPVGPKLKLDIMIIAPCTGNSAAKLINGITDTPTIMAAKSHLRNGRPLVLAMATNDGLGMSGKNITQLLNIKNIYMVPFGQDDYTNKPNSLVADFNLLLETVEYALEKQQKQPVLINYEK